MSLVLFTFSRLLPFAAATVAPLCRKLVKAGRLRTGFMCYSQALRAYLGPRSM